jgi:chemosensory pili system protein ChpA (sensor histidine kinase/response regulator)
MIPDANEAAISGILEDLRGRLEGHDPPPEGWLGALRAALGPWLDPADDAGGRGEAARRLVVMADVAECLAAEGEAASAGLSRFFAEALDRLSEAARLGGLDAATAWILRESAASWGEYLALLDPSSDPGTSADPCAEIPPEADTAGPAIDLAALLRSMAGSGSGPAGGLEETSAAPPAPVGPEAPATGDAADDDQPGPDLLREARDLELDAEIRSVFAADLSDLLGRIQDLVLGLDPDGEDAGRRMHELGRCYHTLKGAAGSVGLAGLAAAIHALEDRLERAGGRPSAALCRLLERSLGQIEGVLGVLGGPGPTAGAAGREGGTRTAGEDALATSGAVEPDGLVRVPSDRFEELTELGSMLLARREAWAEQAERARQLAEAARGCSFRIRASVDRLCDGVLLAARPGGPGRDPTDDDLPGLVHRLTEQAEDVSALAATAREAAASAREEAEELARLALRVRETLQAVRVVPVRGLFRRLVRVARDAARVEGRAIEVDLVGEDTVADRVLLDRVFEPLLHVVRNAVGHGIEPPDQRGRAGKPATGRITLEARLEGHAVAISVRDDGRGLDYEAIAARGRSLGLLGPEEDPGVERLQSLIFQPGFSTRGQANAVSGRGVGMDVVAREVERLRGRIELTSRAGGGTRLTIRLPARLLLEHVMVVRAGGRCFALPTAAIESVHRDEEGGAAHRGDPDHPSATVGGRTLPAAGLGAILGLSARSGVPRPTVLVVGTGAEPLALRVDRVEGALELVVRPLGPLLAGHPVVSGVGLATGGELLPVLDVTGLLRLAGGERASLEPPGPDGGPRALVVDDSLSVRRIASRNLRALGLDVDEASDGEQALGKLRLRPYQLILTDLEMPRMDGFALLAELGRADAPGRAPVVVTSTRNDPETRRRVLKLGASGFVPKPVDPEELARVVGRALAVADRPAAARAQPGP